ncbi:hypothetical protein Leryth_002713 [Lithospermum erythrorhizon]|uniref:Uncharacterized protein n=1 Tax=Lithospermum erythrorhizon TaxID=34254 RepID=A0AAV3PBC2_LITER|nr:hypothetical protein Leryth_002713 [Lithospermum erythrorhizon]
MEKVHSWWKLKFVLSYKNATILVCLFNLITAFFLLQSFISSSSRTTDFYRDIKESEDLRRAMMPLDLIQRVKEIEMEAYVEPEAGQQGETKQTVAVDLISRLNNKHSYSDAGNMKALEEWRKRKMERARQRELGKDGAFVAHA